MTEASLEKEIDVCDAQKELGDLEANAQGADVEKLPSGRMNQEVAGKQSEAEAQPPNGGLEAWLRILAGHFIFVNTWQALHFKRAFSKPWRSTGLTAAFGTFQKYYQSDLLSSETSSAISWIGSIQAFLVVIVGIVAGPLFDRGYIRPLMFLGCFLIVFGMMMVSLAKSYHEVFLAQALCVGLGAGLVYVPALAAISTRFTTKRPIAIGLASAGSSIGGIIFPIFFRRLQPQIGFGWAVRAIAFVNLCSCAVALIILGRDRGIAAKEKHRLIDLRAFLEMPFALFSIALFFGELAFYIPPFYIPLYAMHSLHATEDFSFYSLAIANAGSCIGRTAPFLMGQRIGAMQTLIFFMCAAVVLLFAWTGIHSVSGFVAFCVSWGFVSGVLTTAPAVAVAHPVLSPSLDVIGTRLGMSSSIAAVGILIGTPIAGALAGADMAHFIPAQLFAGATLAAAVVCLIGPLVAILRYQEPKTK